MEWLVWSVVPRPDQQGRPRAGYDRRSPDPVLRYTGPERRTTPDPRRARDPFAPESHSGWLVFESPEERRRLSPIPAGWDRLNDRELERLLRDARPSLRMLGGDDS